jgi:glycosyltransferase involved in cell wall biosynthesis
MKTYPKVSIVIPCRNEENFISRCLDSIITQDYPSDKIEILAVDGMAKDRTRSILAKYAGKHPNLKIMDNPDRITPVAFNLGIKNATGDVIAIVSAHSVCSRDYISKCVEYLKKTGAENVGGPMRACGEGYVGKAIEFAHHSIFGLGGGRFHDENAEGFVDTVYLGAFRREVFKKSGLFNEKLVRNQDIEMNARIRKNGGKIYITPEIRSKYFCRHTLAGLFRQNFGNGYWNILTLMKHPGTLSLRHFVPLIFVLSLLILGGLSPFYYMAKVLFILDIMSYITADLLFSTQAAIKNGLKYLLILPIVFAVLHFSYGLGSLWALLKYLLGGLNK